MTDSEIKLFEILVENDNQLIVATARGFWQSETAMDYESEFRRAIANRNSGSWKLLFDFSEFVPQRPEVQEVIVHLFRTASSLNFKSIAIVAANAMTLLQIKRIWRESGASSVIFYASARDAFTALYR